MILDVPRCSLWSSANSISDGIYIYIRLKDPTSAIFLKSMGFKDIKYDIPVCQIHYIYKDIHKDIYKDIHKLTERPAVLLNAIFLYVCWV